MDITTTTLISPPAIAWLTEALTPGFVSAINTGGYGVRLTTPDTPLNSIQILEYALAAFGGMALNATATAITTVQNTVLSSPALAVDTAVNYYVEREGLAYDDGTLTVSAGNCESIDFAEAGTYTVYIGRQVQPYTVGSIQITVSEA